MTQFLALLKMEFKNKKSGFRLKNKFLNLFLQSLFFLLKNALVVLILVFVSQFVIKYALANKLESDFLIVIVFLAILMQFFVSLSQMLKGQQNIKEIKELLMMPVKNEILFFSKIAYFYLKTLSKHILMLLPILITWAVMTAQSVGFYLFLPLVIILLPVLPILLASFLVFPLLKVTSFLKANFLVNFVIFALVISIGFYYYIDLLKVVVSLFQNKEVALLSLQDVLAIQNVTSKLVFPILFKNILSGTFVLRSLIVLLTVLFVGFVGVLLLAKKSYRKLMWKVADSEINYGQTKTKIRSLPSLLNLISKEFKTVIRNYNHSFSFFTIGLTTPLIVFFSSKALSEFSFGKTNISIYAPISLFLLLIFITLTTSFASTSITREGKSVLLSKTLPIKASTQIKAKIIFYLCLEVLAVAISVLALALAGMLGALDAVMIFVLVMLVVYGGICSYIKIDIKNPRYKDIKNSNSITTNINISKSMSGGLLLAMVLGILGIAFSMFFQGFYWYIPIGVVAVVYAVIKHILLFKNLEKNYYEIEV